MKLFIDTNIFLDLILKRDKYLEAIAILEFCENLSNSAVVADITLLNIDYIASKQNSSIKSFIELINETFLVVGANNKTFDVALNIKNSDLEDTIQYLLAKEYQCDYIISNDKNFYCADIKVLNSTEFLNKLKMKN